MNFLQALEICRNDKYLWFRPIEWRVFKIAYVVEPRSDYSNEEIRLVPTSKGGRATFYASPAELLGDWEVVTPDDVLL